VKFPEAPPHRRTGQSGHTSSVARAALRGPARGAIFTVPTAIRARSRFSS
jgi:hypothetical protein